MTEDKDGERYRLLVQAVTDYAIYMLNPSGIVTSWNPGAERFNGYAADEIIGHHFSRFYTDEDRASGLPTRALATATEDGRFETEGWRIRKDGSRFWAHVVIDPIRSPGGELQGFAKITRDLTERKAVEEALRSSEEQFRLLVQGVTDYAIYMLSPEGTVTSWNSGAERIKGYAPGEIIGRHFSCFYTEEDRTRGLPALALQTAVDHGRFESQGWHVRKDGSCFWAQAVIDAIRSPAGDLLGFAKVTRDITERRAAQDALDKARDALIQSQKMEAIGQLTGGVAHDFNNLLMAIQVSLDLLRKRIPSDPQMTRLLDNAVLGTRRGTTLTQRMLAFARKQTLAVEPLDVYEMLRGMTDMLDRSLGPSIEIENRFPRSVAQALADPNQLALAIINLCVNARDATEDGGKIVITGAQKQIGFDDETGLPPGWYICLSIADGGLGMTPEVLARATEPFFTTKGVGKGTGLGLSMVHGMSEQIGGRLVLKSVVGRGTTAEIWLPATSDARRPAKPSFQATASGGNLRVLVVDDDGLILIGTVAMLEDLGHVALEAGSAKEALEVLRQYPVDVIISDYAMPRTNGAQLLEEVGRLWPEIRTILASGYAEFPDNATASVRLSKPYSQADLAEALSSMSVDRPQRER